MGRAENRAMIDHLGIEIVPLSKVHIRDYSIVAMIDTQPGAGNNSLPAAVKPEIVIDHHFPIYETTREAALSDIRTDYGSTSTIMTEYLMEAQLADRNRKISTALLYGIKSDTRDLGRETGQKDMAAYLFLYPRVLFKVLSKIEHPRLSRTYFKIFGKAIDKSLIDKDVVITNLGVVESADNLAEMADFLVRMQEVKYVLCIGEFDKIIYFSLRTTSKRKHSGLIARNMSRGLGSGGGHWMAAGGKIEESPRGYDEDSQSLVERFLAEIKRKDFRGQPLRGEVRVC